MAITIWISIRRRNRRRLAFLIEVGVDHGVRPLDAAGRHPSARPGPSGKPASDVRASPPSAYPRTSSATRPPCICSKPASTWRPSPSVARPRTARDHPSLRRGGPAAQGTRAAETRSARPRHPAVQGRLLSVDLPGAPLIIEAQDTLDRGRRRASPAPLVIMRIWS